MHRISLLAALLGAGALAAHPLAAQAADTTPQPPVISASGGLLSTTLVIQPGTVRMNGNRFARNLYSTPTGGPSILPPTLRLDPGDRLSLTVRNQMSPAIDTIYEGISRTNFHFHGFNVTARTDSGDQVVTVHYDSGGAHRYGFRLPPTHPTGMHWYHPHPHGNSDAQVGGGMSGAILIGDLRRRMPGNGGMAERVMLLKDFQKLGPNASSGTVLTLNGDSLARFTIPAGTRQLWHIGNVGSDTYAELRMQRAGDGRLAWFRVLARDGNPTAVADSVTSLLLTPAARYDVVVTADAEPATYYLLNTYLNNASNGFVGAVLGVVTVRGRAAPAGSLVVTPDTAVRRRADRLYRLRSIPAAHTIDFTVDPRDNNRFLLNGRTYDPTRIDVRVPQGAVQKWVLRDPIQPTPQPAVNVHHVFHIHQGDFLVTRVNGSDVAPNGMQDRVNLEPGDDVEVIIPFDELFQVGLYVFHCHILFHEDNGMMQNICVYPTSEERDGGRSWCANQLAQAHAGH